MYEKNKGLEDKKIVGKFVHAIIGQGIKDVKGNNYYNKVSAIRFLKSEYLEFMCYAVGKNNKLLKRYAKFETEKLAVKAKGKQG